MLNPDKNRASGDKPCWERPKTSLEKYLIATVVLVIIVALALLIALVTRKGIGNDVCITEGCVKASSKLLEYVDRTADPCQNFYQFACGTYMKNAFRDSSPDPFYAVELKFRNELKGITLDPIEKDDPKALVLLKKFYNSCLDKDVIDSNNNTNILKWLKDVGGWPILDGYQWDESKFDWIDMMKKTTDAGMPVNNFLRVFKYENEATEQSIPKFWGASGLYMYEDQYRAELTKLISNVSLALGASENFIPEAAHVVDLMGKLKHLAKKYSVVPQNDKVKSDDIKTIDQAADACPGIPWLQILQSLMPDKNITTEHQIVFTLEDYCRELVNLISSTPKRIQANYILWNVVIEMTPYLTSDLSTVKQDYRSEYLQAPIVSREMFCYYASKTKFEHVDESVYVLRKTPEKIRKDLTDMIENIKEEFVNVLSKNDWMDEKTSTEAVEKAKYIQSFVGSEEDFFNITLLEKSLGLDNFEFSDSRNIIQMIKEKTKKEYNVMFDNFYKDNVTDYSSFFQNIVKLNAFFIQSSNTMVIPSPILQDIFYEPDSPSYSKYGAIGRIIGHEIMHGFSKSARIVTYENGTDVDWWTDATAKAFDKKIECINDQYENFPFREELNASLTLDENMSDFVGIDVAYQAYQIWTKKHGEEKKLPGLDFTPNQIYWIQANTFLCFKKVLGIDRDLEEPDDHAIPIFRVNAGVRNSKYFAKDFNCPIGSPMNSKEKCQLM